MQLLRQLRNLAVANLGRTRQVALARRNLFIGLRLVDLRLQLLYAIDGILLVCPFGVAAVELLLLLSHLHPQLLETLLGELILFLHERLLLDLHLRELAVEQVELLGL